MTMIPFLDLTSMHAEMSTELDDVWQQVSRSGRFVGGEFVESFEAEWAEYCGTEHCVGVSNGTAALSLSLRALGIGSGDEVIVPANTFIATAAVVTAVGAEPVFVDVDASTLLITAEGIQNALTPRTAGVIVVHLYGQPADMDAINRVAAAAGIVVIEDAAQAHGATWRGRRAGGLSRVGCFSFYPAKNLGAFGDAGAVVTRDWALADRIRSMSNHGRTPDSAYVHEVIGSNDRLDALQAAVLSAKLRRLDSWNAGRRRAAKRYEMALANVPVGSVGTAEGACSSHHLMVIQTAHRDQLREKLTAEGIATGIHYPIPCHRQGAFQYHKTAPLPVVERSAKRIMSLPMFPHLAHEQIERVTDMIDCTLAELTRAKGTAEVGL